MASANLRRAAQDLRLDRQRLHDDVENFKRDIEKQINDINGKISNLHLDKTNNNDRPDRKLTFDMQIKNLQQNIAQLQKQAGDRENNARGKMSTLDRQVNELEGTASHIDMMG